MMFSFSELADAFAFTERKGSRVSDVVMERAMWDAIMDDAVARNLCDPENIVASVKAGRVGKLWGADVWTKEGIPDFFKVYGENDTAFVVDWPEFAAAEEELKKK